MLPGPVLPSRPPQAPSHRAADPRAAAAALQQLQLPRLADPKQLLQPLPIRQVGPRIVGTKPEPKGVGTVQVQIIGTKQMRFRGSAPMRWVGAVGCMFGRYWSALSWLCPPFLPAPSFSTSSSLALDCSSLEALSHPVRQSARDAEATQCGNSCQPGFWQHLHPEAPDQTSSSSFAAFASEQRWRHTQQRGKTQEHHAAGSAEVETRVGGSLLEAIHHPEKPIGTAFFWASWAKNGPDPLRRH